LRFRAAVDVARVKSFVRGGNSKPTGEEDDCGDDGVTPMEKAWKADASEKMGADPIKLREEFSDVCEDEEEKGDDVSRGKSKVDLWVRLVGMDGVGVDGVAMVKQDEEVRLFLCCVRYPHHGIAG